MRRAAKRVSCAAYRRAVAAKAAHACGRPRRSITVCRCFGAGASIATRHGRRCLPIGAYRTCRRSIATFTPPNARTRRMIGAWRALACRCLHRDLAEIDAGPEICFHGLGPAAGENLHAIAAGILVELIEFEVAVIVGRRHRDRNAVLDQLHARALDATAATVFRFGDRAADEAFGITPQVAIVDPRFRVQLRLHHFEILLARHARHLLVLDLDGAHGAGRAGLLAAGLLPALVDQVGVKGPGLRQLLLLVPPDVAVGTGVDDLLLALGLDRVDDDDAVLALLDGALRRRLDAGCVVAVIAHGRNIGDVDHRDLPTLL